MRSAITIFGTVFSDEDRANLDRVVEVSNRVNARVRTLLEVVIDLKDNKFDQIINALQGLVEVVGNQNERIDELKTAMNYRLTEIEDNQLRMAGELVDIKNTQVAILAKLDDLGDGGLSRPRATLTFGQPREK